MSLPGGTVPDVPEPYTGPPPTRRPQPWQRPAPQWGPQPGWPQPGPPAPPWQEALLRWTPPPPPPVDLRWAPPPGTPPHDEPRPFLHVMRTRDWRWWRPLLGLLLLAAVYLAGSVIVVLAALVTGVAPDLQLLDLVDPVVLLITNLSLIVAVPVVWLAWVVAHGMRIGWSASVLGRLRPRLLLPFTVRALATLGVGIGLSVLVAVLTADGDLGGPVESLGWLLVVVFLTTPLQSAAEEYVFRGYLSQALAGWFRREEVGALVAAVLTASLFSLAHAPGDLLTFLDRFAFGLAASATVWLTGGLEAAIVLHAVNNLLVFTLTGLVGEELATASVPADHGVLLVFISLVAMGGYVALVARAVPVLRPERRTAALDLRRPGAPLVPAGT
jgi:uncharacterized protein